jgi:hypothetical protein
MADSTNSTGDSDADAVFYGGASGPAEAPVSTGDPDADAVLKEKADKRNEPSPWAHIKEAAGIFARHPLTSGIGLGENALSGITAGAGSLADAVTGSAPGVHAWGYRPRTEAGKELAAGAAEEGANIGRNYDAQFGTGPLATTVKERVPEALGAVGTVTGLGGLRGAWRGGAAPAETASVDSPQSLGAAAASPGAASSPELRAAYTAAQQRAAQSGGALRVDPAAAARHADAESLPVPIRLTEGDATQDPVTISNEMNTRGKNTDIVDRKAEQNKGLIANVQAIRDRIGPDVFSTNVAEHGDTLVQAYKDMDKPVVADINAKYKALQDANGGDFPLDTKAFVAATDAALKKAFKTSAVPSDIAASLDELRKGRQMSFEDFESLRSDAADAIRNSTDGRQRAAAGIIRDNLEKMPLTAQAAPLKALADTARAASKARFDAMEADPAYDAAISGKVSPDVFVRKFITGPTATREGVSLMRRNLSGNDTAQQTMGVAALDNLRDSAIKGDNFFQAGYNRALSSLDPKLKSLVDPKTAEDLSTLGRVASYTQAQPRGSFVNNSNTTVAAHAAAAGKNLAEAAVNAKAFGVGTLGRKFFEARAARAATEKSLAPYAGILRPSTP